MRRSKHYLKSIAALAFCFQIAHGTEQSDILEAAKTNMTAVQKMAFGWSMSNKDQTVFGGELTIKAGTRGLLIVLNNGKTNTVAQVLLKAKSPKTEPMGDILTLAYKPQGGRSRFGQPLEGEISLFGDQYRMHVFRKAIIFWRKSDRTLQSAFFDAGFTGQ